jgi:glyoxylase-like metal-dependent hydrolase (beta-lactamase superfamily II)
MINSFKLEVKSMGIKMPVYLFQIDDILLDTGPGSASKDVKAIVKDLQINRVIHTHHHEDHTGNSSWIENEFKIPQYIHPIGVPICKEQTKLPLYRRMIWNNRNPFHALPLENEYITTDSFHFKIVHTPGHAEDHIVLIDEDKKICFSGDLYLFHSPSAHFSFESVPEIIHSIELTLSHDFQDVYCSHSGYLKNGRRLLERKLDYLLNLQEKVLAAHEAGTSVNQIRKLYFPKNKALQYFSFFENSPLHTVSSLINDRR